VFTVGDDKEVEGCVNGGRRKDPDLSFTNDFFNDIKAENGETYN